MYIYGPSFNQTKYCKLLRINPWVVSGSKANFGGVIQGQDYTDMGFYMA